MEEIYSTFLRNGKLFTRRLVITNKTHNMSNSRIYSTWKGMRARCSNPNRPGYKFYGGRGIHVCDDWNGKNGFENFHIWSMRHGYEETLTIDRINATKDYCPMNCQWISLSENVSKAVNGKHRPEYKFTAANKNENLIVTFYFVKKFEEIYGIDSRRIYECCSNKRSEYNSWKFHRKKLTRIERQETIPHGSTMEDEFPLEARRLCDNQSMI